MAVRAVSIALHEPTPEERFITGKLLRSEAVARTIEERYATVQVGRKMILLLHGQKFVNTPFGQVYVDGKEINPKGLRGAYGAWYGKLLAVKGIHREADGNGTCDFTPLSRLQRLGRALKSLAATHE